MLLSVVIVLNVYTIQNIDAIYAENKMNNTSIFKKYKNILQNVLTNTFAEYIIQT